MLLQHYMTKKNLTISQFAGMIGATDMAVRNYLGGKRIPAPELMFRIYEATKGKVTANDFYNYPSTKIHGTENHGTVGAGSHAKGGRRINRSKARSQDIEFLS